MHLRVLSFLFLAFDVQNCNSHYYSNHTIGDAASRQLLDFKTRNPLPVGLLTTSAGEPIEVRDSTFINSDFFSKQSFFDIYTHLVSERIPERLVHAKGSAAFGYFQVTNDVSQYTSAEVFNGVGKKTPVVVRLSHAQASRGETELRRDIRGLAIKFYTKEGNLDLLCLQTPVFQYRNPIDFPQVVHVGRRNPRSGVPDSNMLWDLIVLRPVILHLFLWIQSDFGLPNGYRRMDAFPIHTYEISNEHGKRHYVKFNFRTEQGLGNLTAAESLAISAEDPDYFTRDLYNAIEEKEYPSWRLEIDVMNEEDVKSLDFNPFDVTRQWKKGSYYTVPVGRLVLNRNPENQFKDSEQSAFSPGNLVPGIPGPIDAVFRSRRFVYLDTQNYRLGRNHKNIDVNTPKYAKTYNRDGRPPVKENMKDLPNYYPNTFSGPIPYVDESRPKEKLFLLEDNAVDLEPASYFYNHVVESDAHRQRIAENIATTLVTVYQNLTKRALHLLTMVDPDLGKRVTESLKRMRAVARKQTNEERYAQNAQCFEDNQRKAIKKYT